MDELIVLIELPHLLFYELAYVSYGDQSSALCIAFMFVVNMLIYSRAKT